MKTVKIQLRLPEDMKEAAMRQASVSGISLNLFAATAIVATAIVARVGAQSEAARYFSARGSRTTPARAKALLMRLGTFGMARDEERLAVADEAALSFAESMRLKRKIING